MQKCNNLQKTIAIVGGNGFIGKNFSQYFAEKGFKVNIIDRHFEYSEAATGRVSYAVDIHHTQELINILLDDHYVIWLVHASVPSTQDDSLVDDFSLNVSPIIKFLEKAVVSLPKLEKFVYLSSGGTVYGDGQIDVPFNELSFLNPISNYGLSKSVAEKYIEYLTKDASFESFILRPSNVFGMFQNLVKPQGIIGFAFKSIYDNKALDLYDEGKVIRDFIYVLDVANALLKCIEQPVKSGMTSHYNIGSNKGLSIKQVLNKVEKICGKKLILNHKTSRKFDCQYSVLETSKIADELNWKAETSLDDGLLKVWEWINSME